VGTLLTISHTGQKANIVEDILAKKDPSQKMIYTAPPQGLYLKNVIYDKALFE